MGGRPPRNFNLGLTPGADPRSVRSNRRLFADALGGFRWIASLKQVHSASIYRVVKRASAACPASDELDYFAAGSFPAGSAAPMVPLRDGVSAAAEQREYAGDALFTAEPGVLLSIRIADCLPVLIVDSKLRLVAAIHAGWRGALARIVQKTVGELQRISKSRPQDLVAALGPGIGRCCYEVGDEVVDAFAGQFAGSAGFFHKPHTGTEGPQPDRRALLLHTQAPPGHARPRPSLHLDLAAVARAQLVASGLKASAIHATSYCTACRGDLFFSHRREGTRAGRMMAVIGLPEEPGRQREHRRPVDRRG